MTSSDPTSEQRCWTVPDSWGGKRLDAFLAAELADDGLSRGKVQSLIKDGKVLVDGRTVAKPNFKLAGGEAVEAALELPGSGLVPEDDPIDVLHEDARLAVIRKPAGLTVHPAPGVDSGTLAHRIVHRWPEAAKMEGERPGIVHRIDKDTSGLMLVALDEGMRLALSADFAERRVDKEYLALVHGVPATETGNMGEIDAPIGRHPRQKTKMAVTEKGGREARSSWKRLWTDPGGRVSLVRVKIHTGRTHQIRVHMDHIGHPLVGDTVYGSRQHADFSRGTGLDQALAGRQMLHAWRLGFTHPDSGETMRFCAEPPEDFRTLALALSGSVHRVGLVGMPGCGKSSFAGFLAEAGVPVFSADACVAELYEEGADGWQLLRQRFGPEMAPEGQGVDKVRLFAAMRSSAVMRREVLDIVHPLVRYRMEEFWAEHRREPLAAAEVPLLLEGGWRDKGLVDTVVGVHCPESDRRGRLEDLRGWDAETTASLESWQWPEADKLAACDIVAKNEGTLDGLREEASRVLGVLRTRCAECEAEARAALAGLWAPEPGDVS